MYLKNRRVVVTGVGLVTPLSSNVKDSWYQIVSSKSAIKKVESFDTSDISCKVAAQVHWSSDGGFDPGLYVTPKDQKKADTFILYGIYASQKAIEDSGYLPESEEERNRTGVIIGSGIGGLPRIYDTSIVLYENNARKVSPFFIPSSLINLVSGHVSIINKFGGPNHSVATACATGSHAIGDAARLISYGDADVMIAGGAEAAVCRIGMAGFASARALSTSYNDTPEKASRPWDTGRDGFVMGEGAGIVVLEEYEHAKKRGAKIYAEVLGYGLSGDANHITAPDEFGGGAARAMNAAIKNARINPEDIDYINAHGTSTIPGDLAEVNAIKKVFGDYAYKLNVSSTKSSIGHLLGAAGSVEAIFSIFAMRDQICPPTLNLENPSKGCDLNFTPNYAQEKKIRNVMSNSFGFGGTNASLIFGVV